LFQPLASTGGWLLVTQGRAKHMLHWSLISAPISILSVVAGLHWGVVGVAASYSIGRVFVANPLLFWFVGRSGPVRMIDFYKLLIPFTLASLCSFVLCIVLRKSVTVPSPALGIMICGILVALTTTAVLALLPAGRKALFDIRHSIGLLRPVDPKVIVPSGE